MKKRHTTVELIYCTVLTDPIPLGPRHWRTTEEGLVHIQGTGGLGFTASLCSTDITVPCFTQIPLEPKKITDSLVNSGKCALKYIYIK